MSVRLFFAIRWPTPWLLLLTAATSFLLLLISWDAMAAPQALVYREARAATVLIAAINELSGAVSFGSGVFLDSDGLLITNAHVIERSSRLLVYLSTDQVFESPDILAVDEDLDLAALRVPTNSASPLKLASEPPDEGTEVLAVGYPRIIDALQMGMTLHPTVFPAHVSGTTMGRTRRTYRPALFTETTAGLNSGSSGGPLVSLNTGEVVGMVVHTVPYMGQATDRKGTVIGSVLLRAGINYSIPVSVIHQWLASQHIMIHEPFPSSRMAFAPRQPQTFFTTAHLLQTVATVMLQDRDLLELAVKQYRTALEINPDAWWATQNLGLAYATLGRWNDALGAYQTALTKTPDDAVVLVEMAQAYQHLKETTLAIHSYQAAIQKNPCLVRAHTDLGLIYLEDGRWDEAVTAFSRASRCQPTLPGAAYHWGLALEKKGSAAGALQVWEDFLHEAEPVSDSEKEYVDQMRARVAMLRASMASGVPNPSLFLDISAAPSHQPKATPAP